MKIQRRKESDCFFGAIICDHTVLSFLTIPRFILKLFTPLSFCKMEKKNLRACAVVHAWLIMLLLRRRNLLYSGTYSEVENLWGSDSWWFFFLLSGHFHAPFLSKEMRINFFLSPFLFIFFSSEEPEFLVVNFRSGTCRDERDFLARS